MSYKIWKNYFAKIFHNIKEVLENGPTSTWQTVFQNHF